jgi:SPP1 gp7 family putative phage head morphogenesis protein
MKVLEGIYTGKINDTDLNLDLFNYYKDTILKGAGKGFKTDFSRIDYDTPDYGLLTKMKGNLYSFAGAKTYSHLKELNSMLYDDNGKLIPFNKFRDKASEYYASIGMTEKKYQDWLNIEYDTAIGQGQKAAQWQGFMDNADVIPNLKYVTAGDERVRPAHALLDGLIKSKDDPIWDNIYPIQDWGCRCDVQEVEDDITPHTPEIFNNPAFQGNVGKDGIAISKNHPYYPDAVKDRQRIQNRVDEWALNEIIDINKAVYKQYKDDSNYVNAHFNNDTGGFIVKHINADTLTDSEQKAIDTLVLNSQQCVLPAKVTAEYSTSHDININGCQFDIKAITGNTKQRTEESIKKAMTQAGNVVLYFDKKIDLKELERGLGNVKNQKRLNTVIIIIKNKMAAITKKDIIQGLYSSLDGLK